MDKAASTTTKVRVPHQSMKTAPSSNHTVNPLTEINLWVLGRPPVVLSSGAKVPVQLPKITEKREQSR
jgi:hypothetical protein